MRLNLYIGYDPNEAIAYHVLAHSIIRRAHRPVSITPIALRHLRGFYTRERGPTESTDFSISRFLVPYLSGYEGISVYMDCDMVCQTDIHRLWQEMPTEEWSILTCQHDYTPKADTKFLGNVQLAYPRKNWSSFMVFNNAQCRVLTPAYVTAASGLDLHQFAKFPDGALRPLPLDWNWLVGEYPIHEQAHVLHYTQGGPWVPAYARCDLAEVWYAEYRSLTGQDFSPHQVWQCPPLAGDRREPPSPP